MSNLNAHNIYKDEWHQRVGKIEKIKNWILRKKRRIAINTGIGVFGVSDIACFRLISLGIHREIFTTYSDERFNRHVDRDSPNKIFYGYSSTKRDDKRLIRTIEEFGHLANGSGCTFSLVDIPGYVDWEINESDPGHEWVQEIGRKWSGRDGIIFYTNSCIIHNILNGIDKILNNPDKYKNANTVSIYLSIKSNIEELIKRDTLPELFSEIDRWYEYDDIYDDEWLKCVMAWLLINNYIDNMPEFDNDKINNILSDMLKNEIVM